MPALTIPASSPAIRIHQGETIVVQAYSNTATSLWAFFRVVYDTGGEDDFTLNRTTLTSARALNLLVSNQVAHGSGYVVSGQVCQVSGAASSATQRGQCYVRALVVSDPGSANVASPAGCRAMLCAGYVYSGYDVMVGQFVEPGPAGGHGQLVNNTLTAPAAGTDYAALVIPTGAIWRLLGFHAALAAAVAAANREVVIKIQNLTPTDLGGCVASEIQTTGQTEDYYGAPGINSTGSAAGVGSGAIQIGLPMHPLNAATGSQNIRIQVQTFNIQAADQWGTGSLVVEEWVMPN